jgi:hypothetical protein
MTRSIYTWRNLDALKKEARKLLHDLRRMDPRALRRYWSHDPLAGNFKPGLADARYVVARRYGFRGWRELKQRLVSAGLCKSNAICELALSRWRLDT